MEFKLEKPIVGKIGKEHYKVTLEWRNGIIVGDEPIAIGGKDLGPDPYTLFLSALAACTLSTLRMYIDRKGWDIPEISVNVNMYQTANEILTTNIVRAIHFDSTVSPDQEERLLLIAKKCPISKILENSIAINTTI